MYTFSVYLPSSHVFIQGWDLGLVFLFLKNTYHIFLTSLAKLAFLKIRVTIEHSVLDILPENLVTIVPEALCFKGIIN